MLLSQEDRDWFLHKIQINPEWLDRHYWPAVERLIEKYHTQLHQADREGDLPAIRLAQGRLDGAAESLSLICGLRSSETKNPLASGSMARILSFGGAFFNGRK